MGVDVRTALLAKLHMLVKVLTVWHNNKSKT